MNRRDFLKTLLAGLALSSPLTPHLNILAQNGFTVSVPIPPSLMLHSRDSRQTFMRTLLAELLEAGYQPVTYDAWITGIQRGQAFSKPVLLTIDDISMAQGNPSFEYFARMRDWLLEVDARATYAVITRPDQPQVAELWDRVAEWVQEGFQLATHTSNHTNLNADTTEARGDFGPEDYRYEIVASAQLIEAELAQRGIDYRVSTLVTPYGGGYSYQSAQPALHRGVVEACLESHIRFVVGIVGGRTPLQVSQSTFGTGQDIYYMGRTPPAYNADRSPNADISFRYLANWTSP